MNDLMEQLERAKREYQRIYDRLLPTGELFPGRTKDPATPVDSSSIEELDAARARFLDLDKRLFTHVKKQASRG